MLYHFHSYQRVTKDVTTFEDVRAVDVVGAIRTCIEALASKELLLRKDAQLRADFHEIFEPIPHIDELPTEVFAEIHIKDPNKTVHNRSYPSPHKYRDAWQILIQQHLDAGQIRPSSSSWASPAFIVPKADPTALPRWVNNYLSGDTSSFPPLPPLPP